MFDTQLTRSNRNFRLFRMLAPSIVLVSMLNCKCVVALTVVTISQTAHNVSGIVRFQDNGQPIAGARGRIVGKEDTYVVLGSDQASRSERTKPQYLFITDNNGKWSVNNLVDGSYVIEVTPDLANPNQRSGERFTKRKQMITVKGADVEDVLIEVSKGARISGRVIVEGNQPLLSLSLFASKIDVPIELHQGVSKSLTPTGQTTMFTMTELPEGKTQLSAFLSTDSHYIKSISANGIDLLREDLTLTTGMEVEDVKIVVSSELAEFTGRILSANGGMPMTHIRLLLTPIDPKRRVLGGRMTGRTDEEGTFLLRPPPGDYKVDLFQDRKEGGMLPFLKSLPQMTFRPHEQKNMQIRVP